MTLDVLDEHTLARLGCIEVWVSLYWDEPYNTEGEFTLEVRPTAENLVLLREGRWLRRSDSDVPMRICHRSNENPDANLVVTGFPGTWIFSKRACTSIVKNENAEAAMRRLVAEMEPWDRLELGGTLRAACFGCAAGYCLIAFGTVPAAVLGFGMVGLFVSVLWPAACAMAAERAPVGTAALFSFLAIFGDIGCAAGPAVVGFLWEHRELSLRGTVGLGAVYPLAAWCILSSCMKKKK